MKRAATIWMIGLMAVGLSPLSGLRGQGLTQHLREVFPGSPSASSPHMGATAAVPPEARVFLFLSTECPLCRNYTRTLNELYTEFSGKIRFYGVIPGRTDSAATIIAWGRQYNIHFALYQDPYLTVSHRLKATVTPQAIVLDKHGNVVYSGLIDDWVVDLGVQRAHISHHYLEDALSALEKGSLPALEKTEPVGCFINAF